jgi:hypothetical protein
MYGVPKILPEILVLEILKMGGVHPKQRLTRGRPGSTIPPTAKIVDWKGTI